MDRRAESQWGLWMKEEGLLYWIPQMEFCSFFLFWNNLAGFLSLSVSSSLCPSLLSVSKLSLLPNPFFILFRLFLHLKKRILTTDSGKWQERLEEEEDTTAEVTVTFKQALKLFAVGVFCHYFRFKNPNLIHWLFTESLDSLYNRVFACFRIDCNQPFLFNY